MLRINIANLETEGEKIRAKVLLGAVMHFKPKVSLAACGSSKYIAVGMVDDMVLCRNTIGKRKKLFKYKWDRLVLHIEESHQAQILLMLQSLLD